MSQITKQYTVDVVIVEQLCRIEGTCLQIIQDPERVPSNICGYYRMVSTVHVSHAFRRRRTSSETSVDMRRDLDLGDCSRLDKACVHAQIQPHL